MLTIMVPGIELYDEVSEEFTNAEGFVLELGAFSSLPVKMGVNF